MRTRIALSFVVSALTITLAACASEEGRAPFIDSISESSLRADLFTLSHDSMAGRLVGTPEIEQASDWIRDRFTSLGLEPAGDNGTYDQRFDLIWTSLGSGNRLTVAGAGGPRQPGDEWIPSTRSATASASGDVVFAGYGIVEPRLDFDDYQGADVGGKVVLMMEREPGAADPESPFDGLVTAEASRDWRKVLEAQERGAVAVLLVQDVHIRSGARAWPALLRTTWPDERRRNERFTLGAWVDQIDIPVAQISAELGALLVSGTGRMLVELGQAAEDATGGLGVIDLPDARVSLTTSVNRNITPGRNILGMIEGSDPDLQDEVVIIGAHHDHDGATAEEVFNGADDDGSGTVGVMAVAAAYARGAEDGNRPRRSVIFAIWDAEEQGLLGAWYYTLRPLFPLQRTAANINLDMIGRHQEVPEGQTGRFRGLEPQTAESNSNSINILGYSRTPDLAASVEAANEETGLVLRFRYDNNESNLLRRSDHWPFLQNDVPAVWFHTGLHPDYHTANDIPERIEYEKMTRIVKLVHQTSWDLANAVGRPTMEGMASRPRS
jgi:hypothetical protein